MWFIPDQLMTRARSSCRRLFAARSFIFLMSLVSSAGIFQREVARVSSWSLMYRMKSIGPRTVPSGCPPMTRTILALLLKLSRVCWVRTPSTIGEFGIYFVIYFVEGFGIVQIDHINFFTVVEGLRDIVDMI